MIYNVNYNGNVIMLVSIYINLPDLNSTQINYELNQALDKFCQVFNISMLSIDKIITNINLDPVEIHDQIVVAKDLKGFYTSDLFLVVYDRIDKDTKQVINRLSKIPNQVYIYNLAFDPENITDWETRLTFCHECSLSWCRNKPVSGEGLYPAQIMVVGEAPGETEDRYGKPFIGEAGKLFDEILRSVNIPRSEIYVTNAVKCRPKDNRKPTKPEIKECSKYLQWEIETVNPKIIVCMGVSAVKAITGKEILPGDTGISKVRGGWYELEIGDASRIVVPVFHPSFLLRQLGDEHGTPRFQTWQDWIKISKRLGYL